MSTPWWSTSTEPSDVAPSPNRTNTAENPATNMPVWLAMRPMWARVSDSSSLASNPVTSER